MFTLHDLRSVIITYKKYMLTAIISFVLLVPGIYFAAINLGHEKEEEPKTEEVLGTNASQSPEPSPTPSPTPTPSPRVLGTTLRPSPSPTPIPTPTPTPSSSNTSSSTSTQTTSNSNPTPTPEPSPTPSPTPTPTPSPAALSLEIHIDYSGASDKSADAYNTTFTQGRTAWDVMKSTIGEGNIAYTQYSFGVFITGINGVNTTDNQFWEFKVNGQSASVGVSDYVCNNGDSLGFAIATF